jgi:hypothetical protein
VGEVREKVRGATVHKRGRKYKHDRLYLQSINSIKHHYRRHLGFWFFIVPSSMGRKQAGISKKDNAFAVIGNLATYTTLNNHNDNASVCNTERRKD